MCFLYYCCVCSYGYIWLRIVVELKCRQPQPCFGIAVDFHEVKRSRSKPPLKRAFNTKVAESVSARPFFLKWPPAPTNKNEWNYSKIEVFQDVVVVARLGVGIFVCIIFLHFKGNQYRYRIMYLKKGSHLTWFFDFGVVQKEPWAPGTWKQDALKNARAAGVSQSFWMQVFRGLRFFQTCGRVHKFFRGFQGCWHFFLYQKLLHFLVALTKRLLKCQVTYPQSHSFEC